MVTAIYKPTTSRTNTGVASGLNQTESPGL